MKLSVLKSSILAIALMLSATLGATDLGTALRIVKSEDGKNIQIFANNLRSGQINIRILDAQSQILLEETVAQGTNVAKQYQLNQLPTGYYAVEVSDVFQQIVQPFAITLAGVELNNDSRKAVYKPFVKMVDTKLDINLLLLEDADVQVELFDESYGNIYKEAFSNFGQTFSKRLNLSKMDSGKYMLKIKYADQSFYQTITVK